MDKLQIGIIRKAYGYDPTYKIKFGKALLKQLSAHCFIYRCSECSEHYDRCLCYCVTCGTYLRFCRQIYFSPGDME